MKFKIIFILLCFISMNIYAQGGTIKGKVIDAKDSVVLIGANVIILGPKLGAATDINGYYKISNIPPGTYTIKVAFIGYNPKTEKEIELKSSNKLNLDFDLERDSTYNTFWGTRTLFRETTASKPMSFKGIEIKELSSRPPFWTVDMIPIKEFYFINMLDSLKQNPPVLEPVVVKHPIIEN